MSSTSERIAGAEDLGTDALRSPGPTRHSGTVLAVLVAAVALPIVVVTVRAALSGWQPYDVDNATLLLRTWEVGGRHTPLVGAWSRFGWDHPGPIQFWLSAPAVRVLGPAGMLVTAGLVSLAAAVGAVLAAHRVGGLGLATPTALAVAVMIHAATAIGSLIPWNPYVGTLPFLAYLLCAYGAANGHPGLLVGAVVAGSWCVQTHIGYLPATAAVAVLLVVWSAARRQRSPRIPRRSMAIAGLVVGVLWLPPLIDQAFGHGNLRALAAFARNGHNPAGLPARPVGWDAAARAFGEQFGPSAPWLVGDPIDYTTTPSGSPVAVLPIICLLGAVAVLAWRWKAPKVAGFAGLALAVMPVALFAMARTADALMSYVLRWTWGLAAIGWIALAWALATRLDERARVLLAAASCVAVLALGIVTLGDGTAASDDLREQTALTDFTGQIGDALVAHGDRTYLLESEGGEWFYNVLPGVVVDLISSGHDVVVHEGLGRMFKERWMPEPGRTYDTVVILPSDEAQRWRQSHPDAELVASYRPPDDAAGSFLAMAHEAWLLPRNAT